MRFVAKSSLAGLLACFGAAVAVPGSGADVAWIDIPAVSRTPSAIVHATGALGSVSGAAAAPVASYAGLDTTPLVFSLASECRAFSSYPPGMVLMFR